MQVVVTSKEEDAVLTGWGQERSLCGGDVLCLILLWLLIRVCSLTKKLLSLTLLICTFSCMYVVLNKYFLKTIPGGFQGKVQIHRIFSVSSTLLKPFH